MKRIFLSMPYTQVLYKKFNKYIEPIAQVVYVIIDGGAVPVCPVLVHHHAYTLNNPTIDYEKWFQAAISDLKTCDEVWVLKLPTWKTSSGVAREIELATELNLHVQYIDMGYPEE